MTKKELKNLYYLKKEINEQQKRLEELEMLATKCSNEISEIPHGNRILDKVGNYATEIAELKNLIAKILQNALRNIENWLPLLKILKIVNYV